MADFEDDEIKATIKKLTHTKDINSKPIGSYCFLKEITDIYGLDKDEIQNILDEMGGYQIIHIKAGDGWDATDLIVADDCSTETIKNDYIKFFGISPEFDSTDIQDLPIIRTSLDEAYDELANINLAGTDIENDDIDASKYNTGIADDEVPLLEKIEKHDTLNPKLFKDNKLIPEVRDALLNITNNFTDGLEEDEIKFKVLDIKFLGSNASYNYTDDSDIDLHIVMDTNSLECPDDLYPLLYSAYRSIWNKNHDITIEGIPVEIFVETDDTEQLSEARQQTAVKSNGIYSVLNDEWIKEPVQTDIPDLDEEAFSDLFDKWERRYNKIESKPTVTSVEHFIESIYDLRKTSIADDGEYGIGNLVFKEFRNLGYLDHLKEEKNKLIDKKLTLN